MLIFENVTKKFVDDSYGVQSLSFEIEPGELVFITGSSGSGKTTLMKLLTKEYLPSEGEIHVEDLQLSQVKSSDLHHLRRKIGVVFQDYKLLPELNVWENISLPLYIIGTPQEEVERRVTDLLRLVGLADKASLFPNQLSGGEAQRVSIARALTTGPSVIFADEPTGNLDPETALAIANLLHKINTLGTTLLFATHNLEFIKRFKNSRHIHLEDGKVVLDSKKKHANHKDEKPSNDEDIKNEKKHTKQDQKEEKKQDENVDENMSEGEEIKHELKKEEKKGFLSRIFGKKEKKPEAESNNDKKEADTVTDDKNSETNE